MVRTVDGFSLVECLLYLALTGLIAVLSISFVGQHMSMSISACKRSDGAVELYVALAALARDIRDCSASYDSWHVTDKRVLGLPFGSWKLVRGCLMRTEGGVSALVARALDDFSYQIDSTGRRVVGVLLQLKRGRLLVTQYVCLPDTGL